MYSTAHQVKKIYKIKYLWERIESLQSKVCNMQNSFLLYFK